MNVAARPRAGASSEPAGWGPAIVVFAATGALVPVVILTQTPTPTIDTGWQITLGVLVWSALRMSTLVADGSQRLFEFIFWLFCYVFLGLAATYQLRTLDFPGTTGGYIDPGYRIAAAWLAVLGIVAFEVGRLLSGRKRENDDLQSVYVHPQRALLLTAAGTTACLFLIAQVGIGTLFAGRSATFNARTQNVGSGELATILAAFAVWGLLVGAHALAGLRREGTVDRSVFVYPALIFTAVALVLIYRNPISSARYVTGAVIASVLCLVGFFSTRRRTQWCMTGLVGGLLFLFPVLDAFRRDSFEASRDGFLGEYSGGDYDAFSQLATALSYVDANGSENGRQFVGVLLFWIPRSIWPGKPEDTGVELARHLGVNFENLSAPLWAELFVNGGYLALCAGMLLVGFAVGRMDRRVAESFVRGGAWRIVGSILPFYWLFLLRGSLLQATSALAVIVVATLFVSTRTRPAEFTTRAPTRPRAATT